MPSAWSMCEGEGEMVTPTSTSGGRDCFLEISVSLLFAVTLMLTDFWQTHHIWESSATGYLRNWRWKVFQLANGKLKEEGEGSLVKHNQGSQSQIQKDGIPGRKNVPTVLNMEMMIWFSCFHSSCFPALSCVCCSLFTKPQFSLFCHFSSNYIF